MPRDFTRPKISLIGAGQIGGNLAMMAAQKELGDVVLLNDEEIHLQGAVALVQGVTLTDTGRIKLTLQLVENVARASRTKGPNPDTGAPDPGVYAGEN